MKADSLIRFYESFCMSQISTIRRASVLDGLIGLFQDYDMGNVRVDMALDLEDGICLRLWNGKVDKIWCFRVDDEEGPEAVLINGFDFDGVAIDLNGIAPTLEIDGEFIDFSDLSWVSKALINTLLYQFGLPSGLQESALPNEILSLSAVKKSRMTRQDHTRIKSKLIFGTRWLKEST